MPTKAEILRDLDALIAAEVKAIATVQRGYFSVEGHYAQGLPLVSVVPEDGIGEVPDQKDASPTDQDACWEDLFPVPSLVKVQNRIDTYAGPHGSGYVCSFRVRVGSELLERSVNYGPETWREKGWTKVLEEDAG